MIVYCHKRDTTEIVAHRLAEALGSERVGVYHSSVKDAQRTEVVHRWVAKQLAVVVATVKITTLKIGLYGEG